MLNIIIPAIFSLLHISVNNQIKLSLQKWKYTWIKKIKSWSIYFFARKIYDIWLHKYNGNCKYLTISWLHTPDVIFKEAQKRISLW